MDRTQIRSWLETHPGAVSGSVDELLDRCEREVRRRAAEVAWRHARDIAEARLHDWETSPSLPASEAFAAREVGHQLALELRGREPHVGDGQEEALAGEAFERVAPEARAGLRRWVHELAEAEEQRVWREILRFTDRRAGVLVREGKLSEELVWDPERSYGRAARKLMRLLVQDYEAHCRDR